MPLAWDFGGAVLLLLLQPFSAIPAASVCECSDFFVRKGKQARLTMRADMAMGQWNATRYAAALPSGLPGSGGVAASGSAVAACGGDAVCQLGPSAPLSPAYPAGSARHPRSTTPPSPAPGVAFDATTVDGAARE